MKKKVNYYVDNDEHETIKKAAKTRSMSVSSFTRTSVLEKSKQ